MKLIKSRRDYKCDGCKKKIKKGEKYSKRFTSIGSPHKADVPVKEANGHVYYEIQGFRIQLEYCEQCSLKSEV
jgi:hypothetical protein|tara:strand:+ start:246 stop:464 length:219 start_codon:yes stop_codon:yes gene_type:complete